MVYNANGWFIVHNEKTPFQKDDLGEAMHNTPFQFLDFLMKAPFTWGLPTYFLCIPMVSQ